MPVFPGARLGLHQGWQLALDSLELFPFGVYPPTHQEKDHDHRERQQVMRSETKSRAESGKHGVGLCAANVDVTF